MLLFWCFHCSGVSIVDFDHVNVGWKNNIFNYNNQGMPKCGFSNVTGKLITT